MGILQGKTAIITGASKGIGREIAKKFALEGADIAFTYLSSVEKGKELEDELKAAGVNAKGYRSDASKFDEAEQLVEQVLADFGKVDILVNNAGITRDGLLMRMTEDQWDTVLEINLKSVFNMVKAVIKPMMKQRSGSIVNISSIVGLRGNAGQSNYSASKSGMLGFTKSVALELGSRGIRSNAIAPGFIETEMTSVLDEKVVKEWEKGIPLKRIGQGVDIANTAVFLGSEMSAYITGQTIQVDGGLLTA